MRKFINKIKESFNKNDERGSLVETIILVAGFAIAAILFVGWISSAVLNKGSDVAACIEGSNALNASDSITACADGDGIDDSYQDDASWQDRFGS